MGWLMTFLHLKFPFRPDMVAAGPVAIIVVAQKIEDI